MQSLLHNQLELPFPTLSPAAVIPAALVLDGQLISYVLHRSRGRRRIGLSIDERGLRVGAPLSASKSAIEVVLIAHTRWILDHLAQWKDKKKVQRSWVSGESLMVLGRSLELIITEGPQRILQCDHQLQVHTPHATPEHIATLVLGWLRQLALSDFAQRVDHYGQKMQLNPTDIHLSNARSRWGSCHASGRIQLNWRLIHLPTRLIDYVVVHELAHLREMNHSPAFWARVATQIPDFLARRREIRRDAHRFLID
jgi:predicted metal-dependent hydrolase